MCATAGGAALPVLNLEAEDVPFDPIDDLDGSSMSAAELCLLRAEVDKDEARVKLADSRLRLAQAETVAAPGMDRMRRSTSVVKCRNSSIPCRCQPLRPATASRKSHR